MLFAIDLRRLHLVADDAPTLPAQAFLEVLYGAAILAGFLNLVGVRHRTGSLSAMLRGRS